MVQTSEVHFTPLQLHEGEINPLERDMVRKREPKKQNKRIGQPISIGGAICICVVSVVIIVICWFGEHATNQTADVWTNTSSLNYDEFISMSLAKGYQPVDPIEKLDATLKRYSSVFHVDTQGDNNYSVFINLLEQEIKFLLAVLKRSTYRQIDLTNTVALAMDTMHLFYYSLMKHTLSGGYAR